MAMSDADEEDGGIFETTPLITKGFAERYQSSRSSPDGTNRGSKTGGPLVNGARMEGSASFRSASDLVLPSPSGRPAAQAALSERSLTSSRGSPANGGSRSLSRLLSSRTADLGQGPLSSRVATPSTQRGAAGPRSRRGSVVSVFSTETRTVASRITLLDIRKTDGGEELEDEGPLPGLPEACTGFHSTAHLRTEAYWQELLGGYVGASGPCSWVDEGFWFRCLVILAIITNTLLVGLDGPEAPPWHWWALQPPLLLGLLELALRLLRWRRGLRLPDAEALVVYLVDAVAVVGMASLLWGQRLVKAFHGDVGGGPALTLTVDVLSLSRFVRLVHIVPGLHELVRGIMDALQGLFWVLVLMFLMLYAIAILCTRLIGHAELESESEEASMSEEAENVRALFSSIGSSMFLLFQVTSAWSLQPLLPLFKVSPAAQVGFSLFYIFAGWMLVAVMTGTVSFTMIAFRSQLQGEDRAREEARREQATEMMQQMFRNFDQDNSGEITFSELQNALQSKEIKTLLETQTNIQPKDLEELFSWIDDNHNGSISFDEFIYGFRWLNDTFKTQNLLRLREKVTKDMKQLLRRMQATVQSSFDDLKSEIQAPAKKIHALSEQVQLVHAHSVDTVRCYEAPRAIAELEFYVGEQIDAVAAKVEALAVARGEPPVPLHRAQSIQSGAHPASSDGSPRSKEAELAMGKVQSLRCSNLAGLASFVSAEEPEEPEEPEELEEGMDAVVSLRRSWDLGAELASEGSPRSEQSAGHIQPVASLKSALELEETSSVGSKTSKHSELRIQAAASVKSSLSLAAAESSVGSARSRQSKQAASLVGPTKSKDSMAAGSSASRHSKHTASLVGPTKSKDSMAAGSSESRHSKHTASLVGPTKSKDSLAKGSSTSTPPVVHSKSKASLSSVSSQRPSASAASSSDAASRSATGTSLSASSVGRQGR